MDTNVPDIAIGSADITLTTGAGNALSALIGGRTTPEFPVIEQFNVFSGAHMDTSIAP